MLSRPRRAAVRTPGESGQLRYAFANFPAVQALRFLTKLGLAALIGRGEYGEAALAGLIAFLFGHGACYGLDEVLVSTRTLDRARYRWMQGSHRRVGASLGLALTAAVFLPPFLDYQHLPVLLAALGPMVFLANLSVLPTAMLTRMQDYRAVFRVEIGGIAALSVVTLCAAGLGAGAWSLIFGWYANALASTLLARHAARPLVDALEEGSGPHDQHSPHSPHSTSRHGRRFMAAGLLNFATDRADSLSVGLLLGRSALGVYDLAQHFTQVSAQLAANLCERLFFPHFSAREREGDAARSFLQMHHHAVLLVAPAHISAALLLPMLATYLPPAWAEMAWLLAALSIAAGARCLDLLALSAIKASGQSRRLLMLQGVQLGVMALGLALSLPRGALAVAVAIAGVRSLNWLLSLVFWLRAPGIPAPLREARLSWGPSLARSLGVLAIWGATAAAVHEVLRPLESTPLRFSTEVAALWSTWFLVRMALDRPALCLEFRGLRRALRGRG